jgi:hypothetical protein
VELCWVRETRAFSDGVVLMVGAVFRTDAPPASYSEESPGVLDECPRVVLKLVRLRCASISPQLARFRSKVDGCVLDTHQPLQSRVGRH